MAEILGSIPSIEGKKKKECRYYMGEKYKIEQKRKKLNSREKNTKIQNTKAFALGEKKWLWFSACAV